MQEKHFWNDGAAGADHLLGEVGGFQVLWDRSPWSKTSLLTAPSFVDCHANIYWMERGVWASVVVHWVYQIEPLVSFCCLIQMYG